MVVRRRHFANGRTARRLAAAAPLIDGGPRRNLVHHPANLPVGAILPVGRRSVGYVSHHTRPPILSRRCPDARVRVDSSGAEVGGGKNRRYLALAATTMKQLLEAGVHFGHQTRRWNPKMREYIFAERNGIH